MSRLYLVGLSFLAGASLAGAHETWLLPARFTTAANVPVPIDLTSGMAFPTPEHAIRSERVARTGLRLGEKRLKIDRFTAEDKALRLTPSFPEQGIATVWLELRPREIELTDAKVEEYFKEIDAPETVRKAWADRKQGEVWRETYTKYAKTYVKVADPAGDRSWEKPVGLALELVPELDPTRLRAGDEATFRLVKNGKPLAGATVVLIAEGVPGRVFRRTDAAGRASFTLDRVGKALLSCVDLDRAEGALTWRSAFTTLTLEVSP